MAMTRTLDGVDLVVVERRRRIACEGSVWRASKCSGSATISCLFSVFSNFLFCCSASSCITLFDSFSTPSSQLRREGSRRLQLRRPFWRTCCTTFVTEVDVATRPPRSQWRRSDQRRFWPFLALRRALSLQPKVRRGAAAASLFPTPHSLQDRYHGTPHQVSTPSSTITSIHD